MNDYPEMKCPKCGGIIEHDDTYDSYSGDDYIVNLCVGHCIKCETDYQWKEAFTMKFDGIEDFEEAT